MPKLAPNHRFISTNGITLHVATVGKQGDPLVILLHGFPEFWYGWRRQMLTLEQDGFRVWVPDQRGYNLSEKPRRVSDYALDELARDIVGLIDASGEEKVYLAGHDWGAAVAWWLGMFYPDRLHKLVILNVPHPGTMYTFLRTHPRQLLKSWYALFFQLPLLPEIGFRLFMHRALRLSAKPDTFSAQDIKTYRSAWRQPRATHNMLNWYRAAFRISKYRNFSGERVSIPTHIIWGEQDTALDKRMAAHSLQWCDDGRLTTFPAATHWVQHDASADVSQILIDFFSD